MTITYPKEEIEAVRRILIEEQKTIAVAESVTAGLLQGAFSQATDARLFFQGGITTFNVGQKCRWLDVDPIHALEHNAVSPKVANQMAEGVTRRFCSYYGIGVVGYAAPVPEKKIDLPYAWYAVYGDGRPLETNRLEGGKGDPLKVQLYYVQNIINALHRILTSLP